MPGTNYLLPAIDAALRAGQAILEVYQTDFSVESKSDRSPLTLADKKSHDIIVSGLAPSALPILSEEGRAVPFAQRRAWETLWIVDPLDGTKEFVKRNGEFTVNIALVDRGCPIMGVIYVPVVDLLYFADAGLGAYRIDGRAAAEEMKIAPAAAGATGRIDGLTAKAARLPSAASGNRPYTIMGSRSHATADLERFVEKQRKKYGQVDFVAAGSSLKICRVAEGRADIYPRLGPTMEWDTAAGHAIATAAGATLSEYGTAKPLVYNKENLLNPWFVVERSV